MVCFLFWAKIAPNKDIMPRYYILSVVCKLKRHPLGCLLFSLFLIEKTV
jgi:hypothetical protein